jgi:hypothetical protein
VTHVRAPVVVVGDTHGQFHDLLEIFKIAGARAGPARRSRAHARRPQTGRPWQRRRRRRR